MVAQGGRGEGGGDPHYNESKKDSHTVCPFILFFFWSPSRFCLFFPGWVGAGLGSGVGRGSGGGRRGQGETQKKKSSLRSLFTGQSKTVCVVAGQRVATEASGSPTVCLFVVFLLLTPGVVVYLL